MSAPIGPPGAYTPPQQVAPGPAPAAAAPAAAAPVAAGQQAQVDPEAIVREVLTVLGAVPEAALRVYEILNQAIGQAQVQQQAGAAQQIYGGPLR
jgi:hypothetical protein